MWETGEENGRSHEEEGCKAAQAGVRKKQGHGMARLTSPYWPILSLAGDESGASMKTT